LLSCSFSTSI
jgi:hypothetical protein